jgi:hypothetical protein
MGDPRGDGRDAAPIVFHGQVFQVLLNCSQGQNAGSEFACLHLFAKFAPR